MQPFQTYSQMNNPYMQMNNPYMDRMNFLQGYQQNLQPTQMTVANQNTSVGKMVDSIEVVKATDIPMDGNMYYFPKADGTEIFGKQWLQNGTTRILTFKPTFDTEPNTLSNTQEKLKFDISDEVTDAFMKRFDELEKRIDDFMAKKSTSRPKKESEPE